MTRVFTSCTTPCTKPTPGPSKLEHECSIILSFTLLYTEIAASVFFDIYIYIFRLSLAIYKSYIIHLVNYQATLTRTIQYISFETRKDIKKKEDKS